MLYDKGWADNQEPLLDPEGGSPNRRRSSGKKAERADDRGHDNYNVLSKQYTNHGRDNVQDIYKITTKKLQ